MSLYKQKLNPWTGQFNLVSSAKVLTFKESVSTFANLPTIGNTENDARITDDTGHLYVWDGSNWIDQGDIIDLKWAAIEDKPSSSVSDIDDAVSKKHDPKILGTKEIDETSIGDGKFPIYNIVSGKLEYGTVPGVTGPTGPTGATGATGPTGPTGATGPGATYIAEYHALEITYN